MIDTEVSLHVLRVSVRLRGRVWSTTHILKHAWCLWSLTTRRDTLPAFQSLIWYNYC